MEKFKVSPIKEGHSSPDALPPRIASLVTDKGEAMPDKDIPQNVESSHCMI
ncbi:MAG: hypothetical protein K6F48_03130 [Paludibacteraceae bacterium]|nr:hypothetical protein [Paludibacteraceae bacterium]